MADRKTKQTEQLRGILSNLSGSIDGLVIKSNGVIYFRKTKPKQKK